MGDRWCWVKMVGGGVLVGTTAVVASPTILGIIGFTTVGITAGSLAAKGMSISAVANGGGVAAGGVIATLQSAGAAGIGLAGKAVIGVTSGSTWAYLTGLCSK